MENERVHGAQECGPNCEKCFQDILTNIPLWMDEWYNTQFPKTTSSQDSLAKSTPSQKHDLAYYVWITVNPKKGVTLDELQKKVQKMYSKKWIQSYMYVYEIGEKGNHHSHGLIKTAQRRDKVKAQLANSVKDITTVTNEHCFCIRFLTDLAVVQDKIWYMTGEKQDKKLHAVEETKKWRTENGIADTYGTLSLVGS